MAAITTEANVIRLCHSAFEGEHYSRFKEAFDHHGNAITALNKLANDAKVLDRKENELLASRPNSMVCGGRSGWKS
jgi:hypothetical protein